MDSQSHSLLKVESCKHTVFSFQQIMPTNARTNASKIRSEVNSVPSLEQLFEVAMKTHVRFVAINDEYFNESGRSDLVLHDFDFSWTVIETTVVLSGYCLSTKQSARKDGGEVTATSAVRL